jgi:hypothetical protein
MVTRTTYRVSEIDPSVVTRDIVQCLSGLTDSCGRHVDFEIIWIDDTTFLVAASYRPPPPPLLGPSRSSERAEAVPEPFEEPEEGEIEEEGGQNLVEITHDAYSENYEEEENGDVDDVIEEEAKTLAILEEHGRLIYGALRNRFQRQRIVSLEEEWAMKVVESNAEPASNTGNWLSRLWSGLLWGSPGKRKPDAITSAADPRSESFNNKRRRLN